MNDAVQSQKASQSNPIASKGHSVNNATANVKPKVCYSDNKRGRPAEEWIKVESFKDYGVRLYIDKQTLRRALELAGIDINTPIDNIRVKRYEVYSGNKGEGQIMLKFRIVP